MADLQEKFLKLKKQRNAVILAHSYQLPEVQELADYVGDSLGLAYAAKETEADVILFCGVHFMAETAKIVNPSKTVILPDLDAGCSLADSCPADALRAFLEDNPQYYVVAYINCTAEVKALADVICTSGNAERIVDNIPLDQEILFVPDQNLGEWVMEKTGREMRLWEGNCYVHMEFTHQSISRIRREYPDAPMVVHPECPRPVRMLADEICSTEKMIHYCRDEGSDSFIIVTESGMLHRLEQELPDKTFIAGPTDSCSCSDCKFMKMNTLEKTVAALENLQPEILLTEELIEKSRIPIERMLDWSRPQVQAV
ncbi:MAG: quinolinate synthase NadA [Verrucomicrobiota bacterium]